MKITIKNYANITLRKVDPDAVKKILLEKKRRAFMVSDGVVTKVDHDVVIYDEEFDELDPKVITELTKKLSKQTHSTAFAVINYNDETLMCWFYSKGELIDAYNSQPGYLDDKVDEDTPPQGFNSEELLKFFPDVQIGDLKAVLSRASYPNEGFCTATDRHADIVTILRLPRFSVGTGFFTVKIGDIPADLDAGDFVPINVK